MTLGITFLIIFLPIIAILIASNFAVVTGYLQNTLSVISNVPAVAGSLWSVLPSYITSAILAVLVLTLSVALLRRIVS